MYLVQVNLGEELAGGWRSNALRVVISFELATAVLRLKGKRCTRHACKFAAFELVVYSVVNLVLATAEESCGCLVDGAMHWEESGRERNSADSTQPLRLPTVAANGPVRPQRRKHPRSS